MTRRTIIIDTDPGQDDAVAILLAFASPEELDVAAILTVAGNVPLALTTRNALMMCELAGRADVPVHAGSARPMVRDLVTAEYVHGASGIDGADLPGPTTNPAPGHGVDALIDIVMESDPGAITVCALGPLTNVAQALVRQPAVAGRLREIVLMGGSFSEGGNRTPAAEFNIFVDPHAADIVFRSGVPITVMPLDVTHKVLTSPQRLARLAKIDTPAGRAVYGMLGFFERFDIERYGSEGAPLHDPCVIAYLLQPDLFGGKEVPVKIETGSELTMGMMVVDWWGATDDPPNATVMRDVDADAFFGLLIDRIARL